MNTNEHRHGWHVVGVSLSILLLLTLGFHHNTVLYLVDLWNQLIDSDYGHGYVVLVISIYLILRNRRAVAALTPCTNYRALLAVLLSSLLWLLAALVDVQSLQAAALLLLLIAIIWTVLGSKVTWKLLFPMLFIGFAIPVWFPLAPTLQNLTADTVFSIIRVLGLPAFRDDYMIVLPAGTLFITEACSGLRYLLAALTLGALYAYLNYATFPARMVVVLVTAGAALFANILRVLIVVYLAYVTEMQHPWVTDHLNLGWYLFGGLVIILLMLDARVHQYHQPRIVGKQKLADGLQPDRHGQHGIRYVALLLIVVLLTLSGPTVVYMVDHQSSQVNRVVELELPDGVGGWDRTVESVDDWKPEYHGAVSYKQAYTKGGDHVSLFIGYYPAQRQGEELINGRNRIASTKVWHLVYPQERLRETGEGVLELVLEKDDGEQLLVWYWYNVSGQDTTNEYQAKALQVLGLVTGDSKAAVIAVAVNPGDDTDEARNILEEFLLAMGAASAILVQGRPN